MRVYFISPVGLSTPMLFDTFIDTFVKEGHEIVSDVNDADIIFIDLHTRIGEYDEYVLSASLNKKKVVFDFWDYGGCIDGTETFPYIIQHDQLIGYLLHPSCSNDIWFVRKLDKSIKQDYKYVYPIELIQYHDHDFEPVSSDELFSRPNDICFIGNTSPTREKVCNELSKHFKCDFVLGQERLPHDEWLNRHRQAKIFISADAGGFSDERAYQLITIATMIKNNNNHLQVNPFEDCFNCIYVDEHPSEVDIDCITVTLNNKKLLYEIYMNGVKHTKNYYNAEYRANYILQILKNNGIN